MDYISNLANPKAFQAMVSKLNEKSGYLALDDEAKMELLQKLASTREQNPVLVGETTSSSTPLTSSSSGEGDTFSSQPSGVASEGALSRTMGVLGETATDTAVSSVVGGVSGMALGGQTLSQALEGSLDPSSIAQGVMGAVPEAIQAGLGMGRDAGIGSTLGKGFLSLVASAINPALGVLATSVGTTVADVVSDKLGMRDFDEAKDHLENMIGEVVARQEVDYSNFANLDPESYPQGTFSEMLGAMETELSEAVNNPHVTDERVKAIESNIATISPAAKLDQVASLQRDYALASKHGLTSELGAIESKLTNLGATANKNTSIKALEGYDSMFGAGSYEEAVASAKNKTRAQQEYQTAKTLGITTNELATRRAEAERLGVSSITGTAIADAQKAEQEAIAEAEAKAKAEASAQSSYGSNYGGNIGGRSSSGSRNSSAGLGGSGGRDSASTGAGEGGYGSGGHGL